MQVFFRDNGNDSDHSMKESSADAWYTEVKTTLAINNDREISMSENNKDVSHIATEYGTTQPIDSDQLQEEKHSTDIWHIEGETTQAINSEHEHGTEEKSADAWHVQYKTTLVTDNYTEHNMEEHSTDAWQTEYKNAPAFDNILEQSIEEFRGNIWDGKFVTTPVIVDIDPEHSMEQYVYSADTWDTEYETTPAIDVDPEHIVEERSAYSWHSEYETIAQGLCTTMTILNGQAGWTYAVRRYCSRDQLETCNELCPARSLTRADRSNQNRKWEAIGALHVYQPRPLSESSTVSHPSMGLKVLWEPNYQSSTRCGPNYCCCFVRI